MYAIILTGGKQVKAEIGQTIYTEKIDGEIGDEVSFDKVLYVEGEKNIIGKPFIKSCNVVAKIVKNGKGPKLRVLRYRAKNNVRVHRGHRQPFTALEVLSINIK